MIDWKEVERERIFSGYRVIDKVTFELSDGTTKDFDILPGGEVVCVVALTPDRQVIMTRQFRPGPAKTLMELPGGGMDPGEEPEAAAARELLEETGYAGKMQFVTVALDDAYAELVRYIYVVTDCRKVAEQNLSHGEFADVELVSLDEFREILRSGQMTDVEVGYLGLDFLKLL